MKQPAPAWPQAFEAIRRDFGFDRAADERAAQDLARRLATAPFAPAAVLERARRAAANARVAVLGAGDEAARDVQRLPSGAQLWVADGAATAAHEAGAVPSVVVTDLDGRIEDEIDAARRGALVFLHAHGDNAAAITRWLTAFPPERLAGTCQVVPVPPLVNPGGFTDGDRAVHLALALGAREVLLLGFDYERPGRYSGRYEAATKPRKLAWARRLIDELIAAGAPVRYA